MKLQFSLRALLLLMALGGAAMVSYRWPWKETQVSGDEMISTEYRRGWNGKPVKHGLQVTRSLRDSDFTTQKWFVDDELLRSLEKGVEFTDAYYRDQKLHGPYSRKSEKYSTHGQHRAGKKVGRWKTIYADVMQEDEWQAGKLHGHKTWTTPQGRLLQSADFEDDRLVRWNGQPAAAEFQRWLIAAMPASESRQQLLETLSSRDDITMVLSHGNLRFYRDLPHSHPLFHVDARDPLVIRNLPGRLLGETMLEELLKASLVLTYRFERFKELPSTPEHLDWKDRTGVYEIRFEPGSKEEEFWLGRGVIDASFAKRTRSRLKGMLYARREIQIPFDTTAIDAFEPAREPSINEYDPPRTRRDLVGHYLDQHGYFCELRGSTLVFKPHAGIKRPQEQ